MLRDADGRAVRSRLDGELLRDLALATGGAYVPAGTGVLDLESIYRQHIEPRMVGQLDPRGKTVRDEGYQWAVLLGLVFLVSSAALSGGPAGVGAALALWLAVAAPPLPAWAVPTCWAPPTCWANSATKRPKLASKASGSSSRNRRERRCRDWECRWAGAVCMSCFTSSNCLLNPTGRSDTLNRS